MSPVGWPCFFIGATIGLAIGRTVSMEKKVTVSFSGLFR